MGLIASASNFTNGLLDIVPNFIWDFVSLILQILLILLMILFVIGFFYIQKWLLQMYGVIIRNGFQAIKWVVNNVYMFESAVSTLSDFNRRGLFSGTIKKKEDKSNTTQNKQ